jgi:hypothetical protein
MKKSKFTEQQIAFAPASGERNTGCRGVPQDGHLGSDVLSLEATLRRLDAVRSEEVTAARRGDYAAVQVVADMSHRNGDFRILCPLKICQSGASVLDVDR